jgi:hypothetical protein
MAGELSKAKGVSSTPERNEELENRVASQEDKAEVLLTRQPAHAEGGPLIEASPLQGNREQHLKMLRERLRAKEEHARKVREKKKLMQQQEPTAEAS